ncbi:MAG: hypothetical protein KJP00_07255 [Bacteroidia bacterium]|nr:hypothetical protein [Bacteroidia bacterium]
MPMRITAIILAVFVSFLSIKPSMDLVFEQHLNIEQTCCSEDCLGPAPSTDTSNVPGTGCDGQNCNPFQLCNASILLLSSGQWLGTYSEPVFESNKFSTYISRISSSFISDFWHPPKGV